jgi:hypothetical protein
MAVHVFGNTPSPAVSTYGLRKTVEHSDADVKDFVDNNFYVDDGLVSWVIFVKGFEHKSTIRGDFVKSKSTIVMKDLFSPLNEINCCLGQT